MTSSKKLAFRDNDVWRSSVGCFLRSNVGYTRRKIVIAGSSSGTLFMPAEGPKGSAEWGAGKKVTEPSATKPLFGSSAWSNLSVCSQSDASWTALLAWMHWIPFVDVEAEHRSTFSRSRDGLGMEVYVTMSYGRYNADHSGSGSL